MSGGRPFKFLAEGRILGRTVSGGRPLKSHAEGRILRRTVSGGRPFRARTGQDGVGQSGPVQA